VTSDPIELLKTTIPALFNTAYAEIRAQAEAGDGTAARERLAQLQKAPPLVVRVVLEGKAKRDVYLVFENVELKALDVAPSTPAAFAFGVAHDAFEIALEELASDIERGLAKLGKRIPQLSPDRGRAGIDRLAAEQLLFHLIIKDTPDFDEVCVKVALGGSEPPERPAFTVSLDYEVLEQLRARKLKAQALLSKVQLSGDSSRAMQLMMGALQRRS
jgi:hypothetical protein